MSNFKILHCRENIVKQSIYKTRKHSYTHLYIDLFIKIYVGIILVFWKIKPSSKVYIIRIFTFITLVKIYYFFFINTDNEYNFILSLIHE